jgi:hypothetical protein
MAALHSIGRIAAKHEARGLLNLIVLVERCVKDGVGAAYAVQWARDAASAREQLERLYAGGLPRGFMHATPVSVNVVTAAADAAASPSASPPAANPPCARPAPPPAERSTPPVRSEPEMAQAAPQQPGR